MDLQSMVIDYFRKQDYTIELNPTLKDSYGRQYKFDLIVRHGDNINVVFIKDWNRKLHIGTFRKMIERSNAVNLDPIIICSGGFSDYIIDYSQKENIMIIPLENIRRFLEVH